MPRSRFIRPTPAATQQIVQVQEVLVHRGLEHSVAGPVAKLFIVARDQLFGADSSIEVEDLERLLDQLASHVLSLSSPPSADVAVLASAQYLATKAFHFTIWQGDRQSLVPRMVQHLESWPAGFSEALAAIFRIATNAPLEYQQSGLLGSLLSCGLVDPRRFLDAESIRTTTKGSPGSSWNQGARECDPSLPDFWVTLDPGRAMASFAELVRQEPSTTLGVFALGLERCLELHYPGVAANLYPWVAPIAELLCARQRKEGLETDILLTRCCWAYARWAIEATPDAVAEHRGALRDLALAELGRMRGWLRGEQDDATWFATHQDYLHTGLFFVLRTDPTSLWDVLRRLLLALRELAYLSVPLDLRTWHEADAPPLPRPWGWVPEHISRVLELFLGRELERDPGLETLRGNLARFCLDRLKTREKHDRQDALTDEMFVEPDPTWRCGYLHALRELHVNPGGRGHEVLAWAMRHDPDEQVRAEAKSVHVVLRRDHKLPPGVSPRRALHAAFWWLRQTHVLALGRVPDEAGAQRTFRKEVRRARELDERSQERT